jgi:hypothetical protein
MSFKTTHRRGRHKRSVAVQPQAQQSQPRFVLAPPRGLNPPGDHIPSPTAQVTLETDADGCSSGVTVNQRGPCTHLALPSLSHLRFAFNSYSQAIRTAIGNNRACGTKLCLALAAGENTKHSDIGGVHKRRMAVAISGTRPLIASAACLVPTSTIKTGIPNCATIEMAVFSFTSIPPVTS